MHQVNNHLVLNLLVIMNDFYKQNQMLLLKDLYLMFVLFEMYILNVVIEDHVLNEIYLQLIQYEHVLIDHQYIYKKLLRFHSNKSLNFTYNKILIMVMLVLIIDEYYPY